MTIHPNIFDDAKRVFKTLSSGDTLVRAIAVLVRGGAEGEARGWAANVTRDYGLTIDRDEFDRIIARGVRLGARQAPEPEEDEPPPELPIDVRPNLGPFALPSVAGLSAEQLLAVASDPRGTKQRLRELQKTMAT